MASYWFYFYTYNTSCHTNITRTAVIKSKKSRYKVTNWHDYNNGLRQRGDVTIWFTEEAIADWHPEKTGARGRPQLYSDIAIETAVFIPQVFHLPLRQTEGFMKSLARIMKAEITIFLTSAAFPSAASLYPGISWLKQWSQAVLSLSIPPGSRSMAKTNGLRKNTMFLAE